MGRASVQGFAPVRSPAKPAGGRTRRIGEDAVTPSRTITVQSKHFFSDPKPVRDHDQTGDHSTTACLQTHSARDRALQEFPFGSSRHGYEFVAPLDGNGHIDPSLWRQHRDNCRVRRSGAARKRLDICCTSRAVRSMRNGFSITTMRPNMTTSRAIGSAHMPLRPANMSRSATMRRIAHLPCAVRE